MCSTALSQQIPLGAVQQAHERLQAQHKHQQAEQRHAPPATQCSLCWSLCSHAPSSLAHAQNRFNTAPKPNDARAKILFGGKARQVARRHLLGEPYAVAGTEKLKAVTVHGRSIHDEHKGRTAPRTYDPRRRYIRR